MRWYGTLWIIFAVNLFVFAVWGLWLAHHKTSDWCNERVVLGSLPLWAQRELIVVLGLLILLGLIIWYLQVRSSVVVRRAEQARINSLPFGKLTIEQKAARRTRQAKERRILDKAVSVLRGYGVGYFMTKGKLTYPDAEGAVNPDSNTWSFNSMFSTWGSGFGDSNNGYVEAVFRQDISGIPLGCTLRVSGQCCWANVFVDEKSVFASRSFDSGTNVGRYVPGDWERVISEYAEQAPRHMQKKSELQHRFEEKQELNKRREQEEQQRQRWE